MIKGRATAAGTASYAERFKQLPDHFRNLVGWRASSIGIGTYLGDADERTDRLYQEAITSAIGSGINLIDSAIVYRLMRSERSIAQAIGDLIAANKLKREELIVATKGGYLAFDAVPPKNPREWFKREYLDTGIIGPGELIDDSNCIAPRYIEAMVNRSRANLDLETIDIYYLHNPESQLSGVSRAEFIRRIQAAFEVLEKGVADGRLGVYGCATWDGLRSDPQHAGYLSLRELVEAARAVGGEQNHFKVIQLPFSLAMAEAWTHSNQSIGDRAQGSILEAARHYGIAVCASASIMQGRLARRLPPVVADALSGLETDAQRSIQFTRSTPGVDVALVGMKSRAHVLENIATAKIAPAGQASLSKLFEPQ
ncbi:MAG TPA: aldo/keto reductase [Candidatus Binataceae bacterium]